MHNHSGLFRAAIVPLAAAASLLCSASDTRIWEQSDQSDFTRGTVKNLSIRSDGRITLAPQFKELDSTNVPYLWALAEDSKGTLYYAGGAPTAASTRIFALPRNGKSKSLAEIPGLEIHALAVDPQDRLYAAVLPDARIYRIDKTGKPELFFDPKCKYIWSMVFDRAGNLFVATGDAGLIYRVTPDGKGSRFADTEETHARSMTIDKAGNLIVGTEPGGLVLRISPQGEAFVLYQTNKREVTAVAEHNGIIYAAAIGSKTAPPAVSAPAPVLPSNAPTVTSTGVQRTNTAPPSAPPAVGTFAASVSGGSEFYRIQSDGFAERIWSSPTDLVYAIAFDAAGKPLIGTGNKGIVYRVDSEQLSTQLLNTPPTQVTTFLQGKNGIVYAATGNVGNVYSIGPGMEKQGTLESDVLDTNDFAHWGKAHLISTPHGGLIGLETRSGNLNNPGNNWSHWSKVVVSETGGQVASPPARFLQYRLTLQCSSAQGESPELSGVEIAYLPKNIAPKVNAIELAPFNYRQAASSSALERTVMPSGSPATVTLPAVGQKRAATATPGTEAAGSATLQYSKGYVTARWSASDPNGDPLLFKVELKRKNDAVWCTLKDKLQDRYYAFDSSTFPDGEYVIRISASDAPANTPGETLTSSLDSDPFTIDNTPPEIVNVSSTHTARQRVISFTAKDALTWIEKAEYSVDGGEWIQVTPENSVTDSQVLNYKLSVDSGHMIAVRVFDENDNIVVRQFPPQ